MYVHISIKMFQIVNEYIFNDFRKGSIIKKWVILEGIFYHFFNSVLLHSKYLTRKQILI